jgi:hypothetical protein
MTAKGTNTLIVLPYLFKHTGHELPLKAAMPLGNSKNML